ncbi:MAG: gamma carbonic anhydrase family protein [Alphaproteobacteria bacterium]|nr:gamma carbonic anhydrase family protein [Alphaproteobacteria bacterium]OJV13564.1 MAG: gamma carbonic anhydrase family protein [Alphaproteobacteria bacterium 33-17]
MSIIPYKGIHPKIDPSSFIAPGCHIIGDVTIGKQCGIWFNTVIRGDVEPITIGDFTNVQDGSVIHVTRRKAKTIIGSYVTIGHKALLHGCIVEDYGFVGMGSVILDNAKIETKGMLAAGAVLTPGKVVKTGELWAGNPAKFMRNLTEQEMEYFAISAENYRIHVEEYFSIRINS